jgi:hypothetical protein
VAYVAIGHGFCNFGRFSKLHRQTYGEKSSDTLRRRQTYCLEPRSPRLQPRKHGICVVFTGFNLGERRFPVCWLLATRRDRKVIEGASTSMCTAPADSGKVPFKLSLTML